MRIMMPLTPLLFLSIACTSIDEGQLGVIRMLPRTISTAAGANMATVAGRRWETLMLFMYVHAHSTEHTRGWARMLCIALP
jgi:hypothetical protein